jgi:hypothetical protein
MKLDDQGPPVTCPRCQRRQMQRRWRFRYHIGFVVFGAIVCCISLLVGAAGIHGLVLGSANIGQREGPEFSTFGGSILMVISFMGLLFSAIFFRGRRAWCCEVCGVKEVRSEGQN